MDYNSFTGPISSSKHCVSNLPPTYFPMNFDPVNIPFSLMNPPSMPKWPSQITNPAEGTSLMVPPPSLIVSQSALPVLSEQPSKPKKVLDDQKRWEIYKYWRTNPRARQAEIGGTSRKDNQIIQMLIFLDRILWRREKVLLN